MKILKNIIFVLAYVTTVSIQSANLDNMLLIINYNFAHYESMSFIKELYSPFFKNIVFYGPEAYPGIHEVNHLRGYFSYLCIADAMERYPDFDGYLFLMDDCILNAWLLKDLDCSKIWYSEIGFLTGMRGVPLSVDLGINASDWGWWKTEWGCDPALRAYDEIPERYKKILAQNWGERCMVAAYSDLVYIPARYREQFIELAYIFGKHKTFLETALPSIVSCLEEKNKWLWLRGSGTDRKNPPEFFNVNVYFNHPVKFSFKQNKKFIKKVFRKKRP